MVERFARTARERIRIDSGGYRRDHLRALAQRVEVTDREVRIIGSKSNLLQTLTAAAGVRPATPGVRSSVLKWRRYRDHWQRRRRRPGGAGERPGRREHHTGGVPDRHLDHRHDRRRPVRHPAHRAGDAHPGMRPGRAAVSLFARRYAAVGGLGRHDPDRARRLPADQGVWRASQTPPRPRTNATTPGTINQLTT